LSVIKVNLELISSTMSTQLDPVYLISVNTTPDVARSLLATVIHDVKEDYNVVNVANSLTIEGVQTLLLSLTIPPQLLICSSQWTPEQQDQIQRIAKATIPGIKTVAIPAGLNATKGGQAVVAFLKEAIYSVGIPRRMNKVE